MPGLHDVDERVHSESGALWSSEDRGPRSAPQRLIRTEALYNHHSLRSR